MERDAPSPEPMVFSFIYICQSPKLRSPPTKWGKTYGHCPQSPTWTESLQKMGCGLVPQGDHLQHCYHYPSAMQPSARYLSPWLGYTRAMLASVCHSNPQQGIPSTPVTSSHVTQGRVQIHITPEVWTRSWICGRQGVNFTTDLHVVIRLRINGVILPLPTWRAQG